MKQFLSLWMVFSLAACATIRRPDTDVMIINAPGNKRCGYNLLRDYGDDGRLLPNAKMFCRPNASVKDLNKAMVVDSPTGFEDGLARLKAYIKLLREEYENRCK